MVRNLLIVLLIGAANMSASNTLASSAVFESSGAHQRAVRFVDLLFESEAAAIGRVQDVRVTDAEARSRYVLFEVHQAFRRSLAPNLQIEIQDASPLSTRLGKGAIFMLFLDEISNGRARLFANEAISVWPRKVADWRFSAAHVEPLPVLADIVRGIFEVDAQRDFETRIGVLTREPFVNNALGEVTMLQYMNSLERWPENKLGGKIDLPTSRRIMCGRVLIAKRDLDFAAEIEILQLLADLPPTFALRFWISRLSHPDVAVRDTSLTALESFAEDDLGYDARLPDRDRREAVDRWQEWYAERQESLLSEDVPTLLDELSSDVPLQRYASNLMLRLISEQDVGFDAFASEEDRRIPVNAWHNWWAARSAQLGQE